MIIQPFLRLPPNAGIAILPLSSAALSIDGIELAESRLREQGLVVHNYYDHAHRFQRFGAPDGERLEMLYDAVSRPDIHIIMALRGGYGLSRLLHQIDFQRLVAGNKIYVGYSDFNALNLALLANTGLASICGPTLCDDFTRTDLSTLTLPDFFQCLGVNDANSSEAAHINPLSRTHHVRWQTIATLSTDIQLEGLLWGGNLAMLTHLVGSPFFPDIDDGILFIEDVGEHPYRVERMLLQLWNAGVLQRQKAVLVGGLTAYRLAEHDHGYDVAQMLTYIKKLTQIPVVTELPFGHIKDKVSLVIGSQVSLKVSNGEVQLTMSY